MMEMAALMLGNKIDTTQVIDIETNTNKKFSLCEKSSLPMICEKNAYRRGLTFTGKATINTEVTAITAIRIG